MDDALEIVKSLSMSSVLKYHRHKGIIIRHVVKAGMIGYDTPYSILIYSTLAEAKAEIDQHLKTNLSSAKLAKDIARLVKENHQRRKKRKKK